MSTIAISTGDLILTSAMVVVLGVVCLIMDLGVTVKIYVAALRTTVQLVLVGLVLNFVFSRRSLAWIALFGTIMLLAAAREVHARQERRLRGGWGFGISILAMVLASFVATLFALHGIIDHEVWYEPRYAIPMLGIMLGNTMTGVALAMNSFTVEIWRDKEIIEQRLLLGQSPKEALREIRLGCTRQGLIPVINAMSAAGLVSLPGVMTGQILAGHPPMEAVKYQILFMFLIAVGTGLGVISSVHLLSKRFFDERSRLRLDRLRR